MLNKDFRNLGELGVIGEALALYAEAISLTGKFELGDSGMRWVLRPQNFVTLEVHWKRVRNIHMSLRGNPDEYAVFTELPLTPGMAGYSECTVANARQAAAAMFYIRRAKEIYDQGRNRPRRKQKFIEN